MDQNSEQESTIPITPDSSPFLPATATGLLVASVIFGYIVTMLFAVAGIMSSSMDTGKAVGDLILKIGLLVGTICFVVPAYWYTRRENKSIKAVFRFHPVSSKTLILSCVLALGLVIVTDTIDRWIAPMINSYLDSTIGALSPELMSDKILEKMKEEFKITGFISGSLLILAAVFAAGICEEMLIRGMFQGALENKMNAVWAVVISSLVFSFIHINPWGGVQIFIIAIFLGVIAWRTGSIIPSIIMHAMNNFLVIVFNNLDPESLIWYGDEKHIEPAMIGVGFILSVIGAVGLWNTSEKASIKSIVDGE
ncbi:CPBP family intramembrane metalloprotease [bacterium]|nr:CPBP family intramembrane metalloprotease [bacterium]